jgi:hypothetical protein
MADKKAIEFTDNQKAIVDYLKAHEGKSFTLAQISEAVGFEVKSGTIVKLMKFAGIAKGAQVEVQYTGTRKVNTYGLNIADAD